jgi:hypothetical protein
LQATGSQGDGVWKDEFHTSELKQKTQRKKERNNEGNREKKERCDAYLGASVMVCGRMRKSSFHACWSQIGTGTCDMCLTCDGQVRSTKERKREIQ